MSNSFQDEDSQSNFDVISRSHINVCCLAVGNSRIKPAGGYGREIKRVSAWVFPFPECVWLLMECQNVHQKCKKHKRCIIVWSLLVSTSRIWPLLHCHTRPEPGSGPNVVPIVHMRFSLGEVLLQLCLLIARLLAREPELPPGYPRLPHSPMKQSYKFNCGVPHELCLPQDKI